MLDIAVILILILFAVIGLKRGLIRTVFRLVSFVASIMLALFLFPVVADFMRNTPLFGAIQRHISYTMGLEGMVQTHTYDVIAELPIPLILRQSLLEHHSSQIFEMLNIATIEDYISAYFANMAINIISAVLVFALVGIIMRTIFAMLCIVERLPIISTFNRAGGLLAGSAIGVVVVWVGMVVLNFFFVSPERPEIQAMLTGSNLAGWFYYNNPIMGFFI